MKRARVLVAVFILAAFFPAQSLAKKKEVLRVSGGMLIPQAGLVIDAGYDKRLDTFLPGYKVINVALANQSLNIVHLSPEEDKWYIKLDGGKRAYPVIHDLRGQAPRAWAQVPERAKGLVSYPLVLPIAAREVIDLFVPENLDLDNFTELIIYFAAINTEVQVLVRQ